MLVKSKGYKSSSSVKNLLAYIFRPEALMIGPDGLPLVIRHGIVGNDLESFRKQFEENELDRLHKRSNSVKVYMDILSFSPKDTGLTSDALVDLARKYIELRGERGLSVGTVHSKGVPHVHIHLLLSGTEYASGLAQHVSKTRFAEIKRELQAYQQEKYPELSNSLVEHGKGKLIEIGDGEYEVMARTGTSRKQQIRYKLESAYNDAVSKKEFLNNLTDKEGLALYERGRHIGIEDNGKHYRLETLGYGNDTEKMIELDRRDKRNQAIESIRLNQGYEIETAQEKIASETPVYEEKEMEDDKS